MGRRTPRFLQVVNDETMLEYQRERAKEREAQHVEAEVEAVRGPLSLTLSSVSGRTDVVSHVARPNSKRERQSVAPRSILASPSALDTPRGVDAAADAAAPPVGRRLVGRRETNGAPLPSSGDERGSVDDWSSCEVAVPPSVCTEYLVVRNSTVECHLTTPNLTNPLPIQSLLPFFHHIQPGTLGFVILTDEHGDRRQVAIARGDEAGQRGSSPLTVAVSRLNNPMLLLHFMRLIMTGDDDDGDGVENEGTFASPLALWLVCEAVLPLPGLPVALLPPAPASTPIPPPTPTPLYPFSPHQTHAPSSLLYMMSPSVISTILTAVLTEGRVALYSTRHLSLSLALSTTLSLAWPVDWLHTLIPILPVGIDPIDALQAPTPFIIGIVGGGDETPSPADAARRPTSPSAATRIQSAIVDGTIEGVTLINMDSGTVTVGRAGHDRDELLPQRHLSFLHDGLASARHLPAHLDPRLSVEPPSSSPSPDSLVRATVAAVLLDLLRALPHALVAEREGDGSERNPVPRHASLVSHFLSLSSPDAQPFLSRFVETAAFVSLVEKERERLRRDSESEEVTSDSPLSLCLSLLESCRTLSGLRDCLLAEGEREREREQGVAVSVRGPAARDAALHWLHAETARRAAAGGDAHAAEKAREAEWASEPAPLLLHRAQLVLPSVQATVDEPTRHFLSLALAHLVSHSLTRLSPHHRRRFVAFNRDGWLATELFPLLARVLRETGGDDLPPSAHALASTFDRWRRCQVRGCVAAGCRGECEARSTGKNDRAELCASTGGSGRQVGTRDDGTPCALLEPPRAPGAPAVREPPLSLPSHLFDGRSVISIRRLIVLLLKQAIVHDEDVGRSLTLAVGAGTEGGDREPVSVRVVRDVVAAAGVAAAGALDTLTAAGVTLDPDEVPLSAVPAANGSGRRGTLVLTSHRVHFEPSVRGGGSSASHTIVSLGEVVPFNFSLMVQQALWCVRLHSRAGETPAAQHVVVPPRGHSQGTCPSPPPPPMPPPPPSTTTVYSFPDELDRDLLSSDLAELIAARVVGEDLGDSGRLHSAAHRVLLGGALARLHATMPKDFSVARPGLLYRYGVTPTTTQMSRAPSSRADRLRALASLSRRSSRRSSSGGPSTHSLGAPPPFFDHPTQRIFRRLAAAGFVLNRSSAAVTSTPPLPGSPSGSRSGRVTTTASSDAVTPPSSTSRTPRHAAVRATVARHHRRSASLDSLHPAPGGDPGGGTGGSEEDGDEDDDVTSGLLRSSVAIMFARAGDQAGVASTVQAEVTTRAAALTSLRLAELPHHARLATFVNAHNSLVLHVSSLVGPAQSVDEWRYMARLSAYEIDGIPFTLDSMLHAVLRCGRPHAWWPDGAPDDQRRAFCLPSIDARIHFVICRLQRKCPSIYLIDGSSDETVSKCLDVATREYLADRVLVDEDRGRVTLPQLFRWFASDFVDHQIALAYPNPADAQHVDELTLLLQWCLAHLEGDRHAALARLLARDQVIVQYEADEWVPAPVKVFRQVFY